MKTENGILLTPVKITGRILQMLKKNGLITPISPSSEMLNQPAEDRVANIRLCSDDNGGVKLICVQKINNDISLTVHNDHEHILLINPLKRDYKALYLVIGLLSKEALEEKASKGELSDKDVIALELEFDNPETSFFTITKGTPHCEVIKDGEGDAPIFYVIEPSKIAMTYVDLRNAALRLS